MKRNETGNKFIKWVLLAAAVYLGMIFLFPIVLPFFAALVLARLLYPVAGTLEKRFGFQRKLARFLAYGTLLAGIGLAAAAVVYGLYRMGGSCLVHLDGWRRDAGRIVCQCCDRLEEAAGISSETLIGAVKKGASSVAGGAVAYSKDAGLTMFGFLAKTLVAFVAAFLILNDYEQLVGSFVQTQTGRKIWELLRELKGAAGAYVKAQLSIMAIVTAVCIIGLLLLRIPYAVWLGLAIGLFDALPFFGTGSVFVPWAVVCLLIGSYRTAAGCMAIYIVCSFIRQFLEPKLVGKKLGVPPLVVLMSVYIGIRLYGGIGVFTGPLSALVFYETVRLSESHLTEGEKRGKL